MTLVQLSADEKSVHMSCDFRLTNPVTRQVVENSAHKLVSVNSLQFTAMIGMTGVAFLDGIPVGDWMAEKSSDDESRKSLDGLLNSLKAAESSLSNLRGTQDTRLTFVVAAIVGSQVVISLVSNFEQFFNGRIVRADAARSSMAISRIKPKAPVFIATGDSNSIRPKDYESLMLGIRSGADDTTMQVRLRSINEIVSARTYSVSPGCYAMSLHVTGAGSGRPFLTDQQAGDFIPPEFELLLKKAGLRLRPTIGPDGRPMPIRMVQSASAVSGGTPEYFREQLKLQPDNAEIWNNYGSHLSSRRKYDAAIEAFEKAHVLDPDYVHATANLAKMMWFHRADTHRAAQLYEAVASSSAAPSSVISDFAVFCDEVLNEPERAEELHTRACGDENYPVACAVKAIFLLKHDRDREYAVALLDSALSKQPDNVQSLRLAATAEYFYLEDKASAVEKMHKACSLAPTDVEVLRLAADLCLATGESASAAYYYRKLIKRQEHDADVHSNYGIALLMENKVEGAVRRVARAVREAPDRLNIQVNHAAVNWAAGEKVKSTQLLKSVLEAGPSPEVQLEAFAMLHLIESSSRDRSGPRMRQLIELGVRASGISLQAMVLHKSRENRELAHQLAAVVEGLEPVPSDW